MIADKIIHKLIEEFSLSETQITNTIKLIDEGNTIPFIARYRKEVTGELSDEILRELNDRLSYLRNIETKKEEVKRLIDEQGNLTDEIAKSIQNAITVTELDDIYRPFRPKRRTRATIAKEKGLEPLAEIFIVQQITSGDIDSIALEYIDFEKGVKTAQDAIKGAMDIVAEMVSDNAEYRKRFVALRIEQGLFVLNKLKKKIVFIVCIMIFQNRVTKLQITEYLQ